VLAPFFVDTTGRMRPGSFRVLRATDLGFVPAVRDAVRTMRFLPAERGGRKVAQLVQQPFEFELTRELPGEGVPGRIP
jgi:periplasmic protein TonB